MYNKLLDKLQILTKYLFTIAIAYTLFQSSFIYISFGIVYNIPIATLPFLAYFLWHDISICNSKKINYKNLNYAQQQEYDK